MLKINLSDEEGGGEKTPEEQKTIIKKQENTPVEAAPEEPAEVSEEKPAKEPKVKEKKPGGPKFTVGKIDRRTLVLLLLLATVAAVYLNRDMIMGLTGGGEPVETVQAPPPPPPPPQPEPEPAPTEPDPAFVALNAIGGTMPARVWLSNVSMRYDGTYSIKGIGFTHDAVLGFIDGLSKIGTVSSQTVPPKQQSAEAVYNFSVIGTLGGISVPEILDLIPVDRLTQRAGPLKDRAAEYGVTFTSLPAVGKTLGENDLPFSLVGSYEGLKKVIGDLCPEGGNVRVYHMVISPAAPGRVFDRVSSSFSIRTASSI